MERTIRQRTPVALVVTLALLAAILQTACTSTSASNSATRHSPTASPSQASATVAPIKLASWHTTTAPQDAVSLQFAPSNPGIAYLCADDGPSALSLVALPRLYKSADGAMTWSRLTSAPALRPIADQLTTFAQCAVFVDALDAQDVFFQETQFEPSGGGFAIVRALYRSRDGGATWSQLTALDRTNGFASITVFGNRLVAQLIPSVYGAAGCTPNPGMPQPASLIDASDDDGQTWQPIGQSIESAGYLPRAMAVAGATLFAIADPLPSGNCSAPGSATLWRSANGGSTWSRTALVQPSIQAVTFTARADGAGYYGMAQATSSDGVSMRALFTSDTGATWTALPLPPASTTNVPSFHGAVTPTGDVLVSVDDGGVVYRGHAGAALAQWTPFATGMGGAWQVASMPQGNSLWALVVSGGANQPSQLAYLSLARSAEG